MNSATNKPAQLCLEVQSELHDFRFFTKLCANLKNLNIRVFNLHCGPIKLCLSVIAMTFSTVNQFL